MPTIYKPKLLVFVLLGIMIMGSSVGLYAAQGSSPTAPLFPAIPTSASLTPEEEQEVREIVANSGVVKEINGNQDWEASEFYHIKVGGEEVVRLEATWANPVTSSGPWTNAICQGTRKTVGTMEFSNIKKLALFVDVKERAVIGNVIGAPEDSVDVEQGALAEPLTSEHKIAIYDAKTGELVYNGAIEDLEAKCAPGTEDD